MSVTSLWGDAAPPAITRGIHHFEKELNELIEAWKEVGIPQGVLVALLHAHAQEQTNFLLEKA